MAKKIRKTKGEKKQERKIKRKERLGLTQKRPKEEKVEKAKEKKKPEEKKREDIRYIVRLAGRDVNGEKPIYRALTGIKGISHRYAKTVAKIFENETDFPFDSELGKIPEDADKKLEDIILNPEKHGIPNWVVNRRKDFYTGKDNHIVSGDLIFALREDIKRLNEIKSYRGLRHSWGLTVRGQRTKSTHRGKGGAIGVVKKEIKKGKT